MPSQQQQPCTSLLHQPQSLLRDVGTPLPPARSACACGSAALLWQLRTRPHDASAVVPQQATLLLWVRPADAVHAVQPLRPAAEAGASLTEPSIACQDATVPASRRCMASGADVLAAVRVLRCA